MLNYIRSLFFGRPTSPDLTSSFESERDEEEMATLTPPGTPLIAPPPSPFNFPLPLTRHELFLAKSQISITENKNQRKIRKDELAQRVKIYTQYVSELKLNQPHLAESEDVDFQIKTKAQNLLVATQYPKNPKLQSRPKPLNIKIR